MSDSDRTIPSALLVSVSRIIGLFLTLILGMLSARYFGTSVEKDTLVVAEMVPNVFKTILVGGIWTTLIINLTEIGHLGGLRGQRAYLTRIIRNCAVILLPIAALLLIFPGVALRIAAPGFSAQEIALGRHLMLFTVVGMLANVYFALLRCFFHSRGSFAIPAFVNLFLPAASLVILVAFVRTAGIAALAAGPAAGAILSLIVLIWIAMLRYPTPARIPAAVGAVAAPDPAPRGLWLAFLPMTIAANSGLLNQTVDSFFASLLPVGSITILGFAFVILQNTELLTTYSLAEIALTSFAVAVGQGTTALVDSMRSQIRRMALMSFPIAAGFLTFGAPVIRLLFERGSFSPSGTRHVAVLLQCFALEVVAMGYALVFVRILLVRREIRLVALISIGAMALNFVADFLLMELMGLSGIALGTSFVAVAYAAHLAAIARRRVGPLHSPHDLSVIARICASAAIMGAGTLAFRHAFEGAFSTQLESMRLAEVGIGIVAATVVYAGLLYAFRVSEARELIAICRDAWASTVGKALRGRKASK